MSQKALALSLYDRPAFDSPNEAKEHACVRCSGLRAGCIYPWSEIVCGYVVK